VPTLLLQLLTYFSQFPEPSSDASTQAFTLPFLSTIFKFEKKNLVQLLNKILSKMKNLNKDVNQLQLLDYVGKIRLLGLNT